MLAQNERHPKPIFSRLRAVDGRSALHKSNPYHYPKVVSADPPYKYVLGFDRIQLYHLLKTSEGFGSQVGRYGSAHPLSRHLAGRVALPDKSMFRPRDRAAISLGDALYQVLHSPDGRRVLETLQPGGRDTAKAQVSVTFDIDLFTVKGEKCFVKQEALKQAFPEGIPCVAVLEGRERAGTPYLNVYTFYPRLKEEEARQKKLLT